MNTEAVNRKLISRLLNTARAAFFRFFEFTKLSDYTLVLIIAIVIGVASGYGAIGIQFTIRKFQHLFWQSDWNLDYIRSLPWWWKLLVPAGGGVVVGFIVRFFAREAKGHGVPEVMEAILLRNGVIRPRVAAAKLVASAIYIASGGSVGREGPVIQIGSALGSSIGQFLKVNPNRMRTFVACGAASGIAAAFNAPLAGALFALEIILGDFTALQFSPIVVSSVSATVVSRHYLGNYPAFLVPHYEMVSAWELPLYVVLGFLAAGVGLMFVKTLYAAEDYFDRRPVSDILKGGVGGLLVGILALAVPQVFGVGYETIDQALTSRLLIWTALLLVFVKVAATSLSLGSGGSGGIFAPSLFLGAVTGAFFGGVVHHLFPTVTAHPGAYALVAMGGVVAATTHGPLTAILIIFEMTNDYKTILPLMLTCILATLVAVRLSRYSIYTLKLHLRGITMEKGREVNVLREVTVEDIFHRHIDLIPASAPFPRVLDALMESKSSLLHVVDENGALVGVITLNEIRQTLLDASELKDLLIAEDIMDEQVQTVKPGDRLDHVMRLFGFYHLDEMPVVDSRGNIQGSVLKTDLIRTYNRRIALRDVTAEISSGIQHAADRGMVQVIEDYYVKEVDLPLNFVNRRLRDLDFRNRYHLEVLLIVKPGASGEGKRYLQPDAQYRFAADDRLIVFGRREHITALS